MANWTPTSYIDSDAIDTIRLYTANGRVVAELERLKQWNSHELHFSGPTQVAETVAYWLPFDDEDTAIGLAIPLICDDPAMAPVGSIVDLWLPVGSSQVEVR